MVQVFKIHDNKNFQPLSQYTVELARLLDLLPEEQLEVIWAMVNDLIVQQQESNDTR